LFNKHNQSNQLSQLKQPNWQYEECKRRELNFTIEVILASWNLLLEASVYILFGLLVSGLLRVFLNPNSVNRHLGRGRFSSVFKAAFLGIPIPL
jgi:uncharacterized membrane protein YraQ (UPF0718 family)